MDDVDSLLRVYHSGIQSGELAVGQKEALDRLLRKHREQALNREVSPSSEAWTKTSLFALTIVFFFR